VDLQKAAVSEAIWSIGSSGCVARVLTAYVTHAVKGLSVTAITRLGD